jgi:hypothetical protein
MSINIWYWLILVLSIIFGGFGYFGPEPYRRGAWGGFGLILAILLILIGLRVFGSPVQ